MKRINEVMFHKEETIKFDILSDISIKKGSREGQILVTNCTASQCKLAELPFCKFIFNFLEIVFSKLKVSWLN